MGFRLRLGVQDQKAIHLCARSADLELASPSAELSAFGVAGRFAGHVWLKMRYTFWEFNSLLLKMAIEIIDLPIKNSDFHSYVTVYQRVPPPKVPDKSMQNPRWERCGSRVQLWACAGLMRTMMRWWWNYFWSTTRGLTPLPFEMNCESTGNDQWWYEWKVVKYQSLFVVVIDPWPLNHYPFNH